VAELANAHSIPLLQPNGLKEPGTLAELRALDPEILVVASYGEILNREALDLAPHGALNIHGSCLPRWRGAAPVQAAIIAGDSETGVSIQRMVLGLDEGDVMLEKRTGIEPEETAKDLMERLAELGGEALVQALDQLDLGTAKFIPQDPNSVTMTRKIRKQDGRLDWSLDPSALRRHVRAMNSWPGASTHLPGGKALTVLALKESSSTNEPPGTFLGGPGFRVACGKGSATGSNSVDLLQVKPAGKSAMDGAAFLRGSRLTPGDLLGAETTS
jgi:methionyl-tRNA formyltransferase